MLHRLFARGARTCDRKLRLTMGTLFVVAVGTVAGGVAGASAATTIVNCGVSPSSLQAAVTAATTAGGSQTLSISGACNGPIVVAKSAIAGTVIIFKGQSGTNPSITGGGNAVLTVNTGAVAKVVNMVVTGGVGAAGAPGADGTTGSPTGGTGGSGQGAGVFNHGKLTIQKSTISGNTGGDGGRGGRGGLGIDIRVYPGGQGGTGGDGGVINDGTLTLTKATVIGNHGGAGGVGGYAYCDTSCFTDGPGGVGGTGGLSNYGTLTGKFSTITQNVGGSGGTGGVRDPNLGHLGSRGNLGGIGGVGGLLNHSVTVQHPSTVTLTRSTVSRNVGGAGGSGGDGDSGLIANYFGGGGHGGDGGWGSYGGLLNAGIVTLDTSTVASNTGGGGGSGGKSGDQLDFGNGKQGGAGGSGNWGGIYNGAEAVGAPVGAASLTLSYATIGGNISGAGGAGGAGGSCPIVFGSCLAGTSSGATGSSGAGGSNGVANIATAITSDSIADHCSGSYGSGGYNVYTNGDDCNVNAGSDVRGILLNLQALANNGGPTQTIKTDPVSVGILFTSMTNTTTAILISGSYHPAAAIWIQIDNEQMKATWASNGIGFQSFTVVRGINGTTAAAHSSAVVYQISPAVNLVPTSAQCPGGGKDQRNFPRPSASSTACDSGAYEL